MEIKIIKFILLQKAIVTPIIFKKMKNIISQKNPQAKTCGFTDSIVSLNKF